MPHSRSGLAGPERNGFTPDPNLAKRAGKVLHSRGAEEIALVAIPKPQTEQARAMKRITLVLMALVLTAHAGNNVLLLIADDLGTDSQSLYNTNAATTDIIFIGDNGTPGQVIQSPYDAAHSKGTL
jgi:hypothetical protein